MFQNINEDTIEIDSKNTREAKHKINLFSKVFTKENIAIYLVSFMLSLVSLNGEFSIFSISMLGACFASSVPLLGVIIVSIVGNAIKFGIGGALGYFLTALVVIASFFIIKPYYNEKERNEKIKIGKNIFISTILVQVVQFAMSTFTLYDVLSAVTVSIIALVFYKIFVNSVILVQEFYKQRAFSIEEVIGASLLLSIAVCGFGDLSLFGLNICNILSILIVMILGWKNGVLVGATSGVTIGVTLGIITGTEPIMIAAYAISGLIAGLLNRFGKVGVVAGFAVGNIVLAYASNGYTVELIHFKEILVASIGLLAVPKTFNIDLEEFIGNGRFLPVVPSRALNKSKEVATSLNNVSEAIQEMATTYKVEENKPQEELMARNKQIFISEMLNNLDNHKENILFEDLSNSEGEIVDSIFKYMIEKQEIDRANLLKIFADNNSYIIGFDDEDISPKLENDILQIVRIINLSYKVSKSDFIWQKKVEQNQKNIKKQLNEVSKAIGSMAEGIEKDIQAEEKYEKEKAQIIELIKQKNIEIEDVVIKHKTRYMVEIYSANSLETTEINTLEQILTKVLKEKIVLNYDASTEKILNFLSDDKYKMALGMTSATKSKSEQSGDSILNIRLKDGKYLIAISDGMGTGKEAKKSSKQALKMLENLLLSGFDKETSLKLINTSLINKNIETFATLDIAIVDLYKGNIEFIKSGACPTYIKNKKRVQLIKSSSLPTGIVENSEVETFDRDIKTGDIVLMCSDGILDSNIEYKNKELWVKYMLEDIETTNTQKISDLILNEAIDNNFGVAKDDMSIITFRIIEK